MMCFVTVLYLLTYPPAHGPSLPSPRLPRASLTLYGAQRPHLRPFPRAREDPASSYRCMPSPGRRSYRRHREVPSRSSASPPPGSPSWSERLSEAAPPPPLRRSDPGNLTAHRSVPAPLHHIQILVLPGIRYLL